MRCCRLSNAYQSAIPRLILQPLSLMRMAINCRNGEQGEIIVSGPAVSKGYMNNPEKTAEAFFEFEGLPAYHTGDVGTHDG